jgi:hypothetical protein
MQDVLKELILTGGTALISFLIAWLKKKADIKSIKNGSKSLDDL